MGNRPEDAIARRAGKLWIQQDYSKVDIVNEYVQRLKIDRLVPGCTDVSMRTCIEIQGDNFQFDTLDAYKKLNKKNHFRDLCAQLDLPAPRRVSLDQISSGNKFICKPVDSFSGNGISVFSGDDKEATRIAVSKAKAASPSGKFVVEPFVIGQLHSWSTFIEGGRIDEGFFVFEGSSVDPFAVDTSFISWDFPRKFRDILAESLNKIAKFLSLKDGLIHIQFLCSQDAISIVEITRRCPGDLYAKLIEYSTGYDYAAKYASYFIGEQVSSFISKRAFILRHTVTSDQELTFSGIEWDSFAPLHAFYPLIPSGKLTLPGHAGRIAIAFFDAQNKKSIEELSCRLLSRAIYTLV
jgi:predicted ATP-grasp superfamily ATP-dependent carboligase